MRQNVSFERWITWFYVMLCIWHGLGALYKGTRAKPGNHLVTNKADNSNEVAFVNCASIDNENAKYRINPVIWYIYFR